MNKATTAAVLALLIAAPMLISCSNPGATTCDQYAAMPSAARRDVEKQLLQSHNLEDVNLGNALGVTKSIDNFCGCSDNIIAGLPSSTRATKNNSSSIDKAVDWSAKRW
ncbi:hypothetical protein [Desulfosporosinus metallidurans]|uniref:hypothetical protein n=1 Tax=Desulfosporosinus metallidurans TaxID=1888891 RepID=UPI00094D09A1|nr:hypothetical protein [Desulfosporosinus metallidurans]